MTPKCDHLEENINLNVQMEACFLKAISFLLNCTLYDGLAVYANHIKDVAFAVQLPLE